MWIRLDYDTGDYVLTDGSFERDDSLATPVFLRLFTQRGSVPDDPDFGSRLHELRREKRPVTAAKRAPAMVQEALQPLLDDGLAVSLEVAAEPGVLALDGQRTDGVSIHLVLQQSGDEPYVFRIFQEVGA